MNRYSDNISSVTVGTTSDASESVPFQDFAGGCVYVPAASSITVLTWYASYDDKTYFALQDGFGSAIATAVTAEKCCPIPEECFGCSFLKATDPVGGSIYVSLKT